MGSHTAWVGTSGWQYRDWRGPFYPRDLPMDEWLQHYVTRFVTTEVNNTFYRLPPRATFERWERQTPEGFLMAVKASRYLTHIKRLRDPSEPVERLLEAAQGLGSSLGPVLFQLPPTLRADVGLLRDLLQSVGSRVRSAVEFRHPSWMRSDVLDTLADEHAALVLADRPRARIEPLATARWTYIRFHRGAESGHGYTRRKLVRWAERLAAMPVSQSFTYFNNDPGAAAPRDAATFRQLLEERGLIARSP